LHEAWSCAGSVGELRGTLLHFSYPDVASYRAKYDRYTSLEAQRLHGSVLGFIGACATSVLRLAWLLFGKGRCSTVRAAVRRVRIGDLSGGSDGESVTSMRPARVGLDARLTRQLSVGMKTYARELVARLPRVAPEFTFVPLGRGKLRMDEQVRLPLAIARSRVELVHFLSQYVPAVVPGRFVVTIHDLIHLHFPAHFKSKVRPYYETFVRWHARGRPA